MNTDVRRIVLVALSSCALAACERGMRDMYDQNRPHPDARAARFDDGRDPRPQPDGSVVHASGVLAATSSGRVTASEQPTLARQRLDHGKTRYDIFCAPCHSPVGDGDGMVVRRGFPKPESFHTPKLRALSDRDFNTAVVDGFGAMRPMGRRLDASDREAIIDYIRALQLSQNAKLDDVPAEQRQLLEGSTR